MDSTCVDPTDGEENVKTENDQNDNNKNVVTQLSSESPRQDEQSPGTIFIDINLNAELTTELERACELEDEDEEIETRHRAQAFGNTDDLLPLFPNFQELLSKRLRGRKKQNQNKVKDSEVHQDPGDKVRSAGEELIVAETKQKPNLLSEAEREAQMYKCKKIIMRWILRRRGFKEGM